MLQPPQTFIARGFESSVFCVETLGFNVCLVLLLLFLAYLHLNVGPSSQPAPALTTWSTSLPCHMSSASIFAPPTSLDEVFFNFLVVVLPCSLISSSSCYYLFLNWLLSFFWLCQEVKHFYLLLHLAGTSRDIVMPLILT